jgi:hypothetical protein
MPRSSQYPWKAPLVNWDPLSVMIRFGTPNLHMMDLMNLTADFLVDFDHWGCFRPLDKLIDGNIEELVPADSAMSSPHTVKGHEGGIIYSICAGMWICLVWN